MRTAVSAAVTAHHLRWQAAFIIEAYRDLSRPLSSRLRVRQ
jgi:hypothetical protein